MGKNDYKILENLDEKYFSDMLYMLLTTKSLNKGLRTQFANLFVEKVYATQKSKNYSLSNSSVFREFPLNMPKRTTKNIDLLFLDLDKNDDVVIGIENKFLTQDRMEQLEGYYKSLTNIFTQKTVKIVYLTLDGRTPKCVKDEKLKENLICMSWIEDIQKMVDASNEELQHTLNPSIVHLQKILTLIKNISADGNTIKESDNVSGLANYIIQILNGNKKNNKEWKLRGPIDKNEQNSYTIYKHNENTNKTNIKISVAFYGKYYSLDYNKGKKFFIPAKINADQGKNMVHQFCKLVLDKDDLKPQETDNKLEEIFAANDEELSKLIKNAIKNYLDKKEIKNECKKIV